MLKYPNCTPCPTTQSEGLSFELSVEPTEELNFTTHIQAALRLAGPRRKRSTRSLAEEQKSILPHASGVRLRESYGRANTLPHDHGRHQQSMDRRMRTTSAGSMPARRRASLLPTERAYDQVNCTEVCEKHGRDTRQDAVHIHKKPRRRTIYVPSDDTTILTIHPGLQSDARGLNNSPLSFIHSHPVNHEVSQGNRKPLAAAPKRAPLHSTLKPLQENENQVDIAGTGPGKENVPPAWPDAKSHTVEGSKARRVSIFVAAPSSDNVLPDRFVGCDRRPAKDNPIALSNNAATLGELRSRMSRSPGEDAKQGTLRDSMINQRNGVCYGPNWKAPVLSKYKQSTAVPRFAPVVDVKDVTKHNRYPILSEDINKPGMFEETWLNDQQVAIQQIINELFEVTQKRDLSPFTTHEATRQSLLRLYQNSECSLLHHKIQASLLYGALSPPKGTLAETSRLRHDFGFRAKFIAVWTDSYGLEPLHAAAEVVIGREATIGSQNTSIEGQHRRGMGKMRKKDIENFLDSCLLRNEDTFEHQPSSPAWCWRRTVLRSLMIIYLLASTLYDRAKETRLITGNIYQASSRLKSSRSILTEVCSLLLPSIGDGSRSLLHLRYHLHHNQVPLSEYQYKIKNLATDLRDGIMLARLAEILLYPPESLSQLDNSSTNTLPTDGLLTSTIENRQNWVLSQHLKFPCVARTQKLYNVQVTLSALHGNSGVGEIVYGLRAEDIVDGHHERTVALLWGLVGKRGLAKLVDFDRLRREIGKMERFNYARDGEVREIENDGGEGLRGLEYQTYLLKEWARAITARHGLQVLNLTSSFADGEIFGKIIDEYQLYLAKDRPSQRSNAVVQPLQLESRLRSVGCSASFASIFRHQKGARIFDRNFTIAALAFLCSRLLGGSEKGRAAAVIQRAFRRSKIREMFRRRLALIRLSYACKAVFMTKRRVIKAARVLQRAWRAHVASGRRNETVGVTGAHPRKGANAASGKLQTLEADVDIWLL